MHIPICLFALLAFAGSASAQIHLRVLEPTRGKMGYDLTAFDGRGTNYIVAGLHHIQVPPYALVAIFRSTDAGKTWFERDVDSARSTISNAVRGAILVDSLHAFVWLDSNMILRTRDGCQTWEHIRGPADLIFSLSFADSLHGIAVGNWYPNIILRTSDGGETWDSTVFRTPEAVRTSKAIFKDHYSFLDWGKGPYYETYDNFATVDSFKVAISTTSSPNLSNFVESGDTIIAFGNQFPQGYGIAVKSTDHGRTWSEIKEAQGVFTVVSCVSDPSASVVFFGGSFFYSDILVYRDGGDLGVASYTFDKVTLDTVFPAQIVVGMALTPDGHIVGALNTDPWGFGYGAIVYGEFETASVDEAPKDTQSLYPNPASNVIHVNGVPRDVTIYDALGRAYSVSGHDGSLDISSLPPGVYYISNGMQRARFVKE